MSMSKNIARLAVTAGLTAALSFGGVMAPVAMAFAEGAAGSTVTFNDPTYQETTTYKGIQIFTATVTTTAEGTTVNNIAWASDDAHEAVVKAIKEMDESYRSENAQEAADWLNNNNKEANATEANTKVSVNHVLNKIAANLKNSGQWKVADNGPSLSGLSAGYWLFLTNEVDNTAADNSTDTYSSPVYAVIDGTSSATIKPKKSVPTVTKKILDDFAAKDDLSYTQQSGWEDVADSQIGQEVNYKLTGTIASNYATYDSYAYEFTDKLSKGLDYVNGSVEVYALNGTTYTKINDSKYSVTNADANNGNTLTVKFEVSEGKNGLKDVAGVDANTQIVVFYKAKLNKDAVIGNTTDNTQKGGNPNTVTLRYSNNPYGEGTGTTIEDTVADFAFKLNLNKVDQGTEKGLGDAVFTIQSADDNTKDQYVVSKTDEANGVIAGQLVTVTDPDSLPEYVKFTSSSDESKKGTIEAKGLDAGSYKVTEIKTPDDTKYTKAKPFTFTITPTYNKTTMKVETLEAKVSPADEGRSDIAFGTLDGNAGDNDLNGQNGTGTNAATGEVTINVGNTKSVGLPLTGLNGVTFTWIAGGAVLCIGVAHLIRSRKQAEESEQE